MCLPRGSKKGTPEKEGPHGLDGPKMVPAVHHLGRLLGLLAYPLNCQASTLLLLFGHLKWPKMGKDGPKMAKMVPGLATMAPR